MNNIVLVGVGGAGVSALARLFLQLGFTDLIGIDRTEGELTQDLASKGMNIVIGHGNYEVQPDDFVIYSGAGSESPEVKTSISYIGQNHKKVFPPLSYFQFLGEISKYFSTIAIAGTHGKSTTTALTAHALSEHHPAFGLGIVGAGVADREGANVKVSVTHTQDIRDIIHHIIDPKGPNVEHLMKKHLFVIEACEYNYQFLSLDVDYAVLTNIELDHADVYGTFDNYLDTFIKFCGNVHKGIFCFADTQGLQKIRESLSSRVHGIELGKASEGGLITIVEQQQFDFQHMLGSHNHLNASLALAVCTHMDDLDNISSLKSTIESFTSLWRRGELLGHNNHGVPIITDYAHHPTELASVLDAIREKYADQHIHLIFQPHQARRVVEFRDEFVETLQGVENPIIYHIYTARETMQDLATYTISSKHLKSQVSSLESFDDLGQLFIDKCNGTYVTDFADIQKNLTETQEGVIVICTAGDLDWEVRKFI